MFPLCCRVTGAYCRGCSVWWRAEALKKLISMLVEAWRPSIWPSRVQPAAAHLAAIVASCKFGTLLSSAALHLLGTMFKLLTSAPNVDQNAKSSASGSDLVA